jgi:hypothetical protein
MTIRLRKPVKLLEWGTGTNTTNQKWEQCGEGRIQSCKRKDGFTTMIVDLTGKFEKQNLRDDTVKVAQLGEGMAPHAEKWGAIKDRWGEVAMGLLKSIDNTGGKTVVTIEIPAATKVSNLG